MNQSMREKEGRTTVVVVYENCLYHKKCKERHEGQREGRRNASIVGRGCPTREGGEGNRGLETSAER